MKININKIKNIFFITISIIGLAIAILFVPFNGDFTVKEKNNSRQINNFFSSINSNISACYTPYYEISDEISAKNKIETDNLLKKTIFNCTNASNNISNIVIPENISSDKAILMEEIKIESKNLTELALEDLNRFKNTNNLDKKSKQLNFQNSNLITSKTFAISRKEIKVSKKKNVFWIIASKISDKIIIRYENDALRLHKDNKRTIKKLSLFYENC